MKSTPSLVTLARRAARTHAKAAEANAAWVEAFRNEYGHDDISDALVEAVEYSTGNTACITAALIEQFSRPDRKF